MEFNKIKVTAKDIENVRKVESAFAEIANLQEYFNRRKLEVLGVSSNVLHALTDEQIEYYNSARVSFYELEKSLWGCQCLNEGVRGTITIMEKLFRDNNVMEG